MLPRRTALNLTALGLAACLYVVLVSPHERLFDPLTLVIAGCAVLANLTAVEIDRPLVLDASFVPFMLAIAFLGPASAFLVCLAAELGSWPFERRRPAAVAINVLGTGGPNLLAAAAVDQLAPSGASLYGVLLGVGGFAYVINGILVTVLIGSLDRADVPAQLRGHVKLMPAILINLILGVAAAAIYRDSGLGVAAFVLLTISAFNYVVGQAISARERGKRLADVATSRGRLVAQLLDGEDRQRRSISEQLHDQAMQDLLVARQELSESRGQDPVCSARTQAAIDRALSQLRGTILDLHPSIAEREGLLPAVDAIVRQQSRLGNFETATEVEPNATGLCDRLLLSLVRELLSNVARHASATRVVIQIVRRGERVVLEVRDDGVGFDSNDRSAAFRSGHIGLSSSEERVDAVGGSLSIKTAAGEGTQVRIELPLEARLMIRS